MIGKMMLAALGTSAFVLSLSPDASAHGRFATDLRRDGVFVLGNDAEVNTVLSFTLSRGELKAVGTVESAGKGGAGGNQGALALLQERGVLLAVNAGSHTLAAFEIGARSLELTDLADAGGTGPMSIATCTPPGWQRRPLVYVLNEDSRSIAGFSLNRWNQLDPIPGSTQRISDNASAAAQILFDKTCSSVVVIERNPASFMLYRINQAGVAGPGVNIASMSVGQLGSAITRGNQLFVSETGTSAASSFAIDPFRARITPITQTLANEQAGSCWAVATERTFRCEGARHGRDCSMGYVMNVGSSNISSYSIARNGELKLHENVAAASMGSAFDGTLADDDRYLVVQSRVDTTERALNLYEIGADGGLEYLQVLDGLPATINGVAAVN